jgi:hypothetical protein
MKEKLIDKTQKIKNISATFKLILNQWCKEILKQDQKKKQEKNDLGQEALKLLPPASLYLFCVFFRLSQENIMF